MHGNQKKAVGSRIRSDKTDFKTKTAKRKKQGHYLMIILSIHHDDNHK